jgi:hypothetical protein
MRAVDGAKKSGPKDKDKADAKGKRPRKRPALAAVPDGDPPAAKKPKAPRPIRGEPAQAASPRPVVAPAPAPKRAPAQRNVPASKGKKRELPPYLRVVK